METHAGLFERASICPLAKGKRRLSCKDVIPGARQTRRAEKKAPTRLQSARYAAYDAALMMGRQQKQQADCDNSIKASPEKGAGLSRLAGDLGGGKLAAELGR